MDAQEESGTLAAPAFKPSAALKEEAFPSLAAAVKEGPKKKAKGKALPLGAFLAGGAAANSRANLDDKSILLALPKASSGAPREEGGGGLGGAFKEYGGDRGGGWPPRATQQGAGRCAQRLSAAGVHGRPGGQRARARQQPAPRAS